MQELVLYLGQNICVSSAIEDHVLRQSLLAQGWARPAESITQA
ncbi:MAG: hypothetical protein AAGA95_01200 [Pseudomonadota bacterium]